MFDTVDENTTPYEKDTIIKALEAAALFGRDPNIFVASEGENFFIEVTKEEGRDYTGFNLRVYNDEDKSPLGGTVAGNNDKKQEAIVEDLDLIGGRVYRINIVLETDDVSPDIIALLSEAYLVVNSDVDLP